MQFKKKKIENTKKNKNIIQGLSTAYASKQNLNIKKKRME